MTTHNGILLRTCTTCNKDFAIQYRGEASHERAKETRTCPPCQERDTISAKGKS
jgi:hypothetical protein